MKFRTNELKNDLGERDQSVFKKTLQLARHNIGKHDIKRNYFLLSPLYFVLNCWMNISSLVWLYILELLLHCSTIESFI